MKLLREQPSGSLQQQQLLLLLLLLLYHYMLIHSNLTAYLLTNRSSYNLIDLLRTSQNLAGI